MALSLQAVAVLDSFLFFSTKERELPAGAAQGAVSPAEAQQRLYHRELSRLLELLHPCSADVLQTSTQPFYHALQMLRTSLQGMASETLKEGLVVTCLGGCRSPRVWKPRSSKRSRVAISIFGSQ